MRGALHMLDAIVLVPAKANELIVFKCLMTTAAGVRVCCGTCPGLDMVPHGVVWRGWDPNDMHGLGLTSLLISKNRPIRFDRTSIYCLRSRNSLSSWTVPGNE